MLVSPITSTTAAEAADTTSRVAQKSLGQSDFLKLMTVQLQQQDPMKPMDDTAFIAQMAQFSSLQEMKTMTTQMTSLGTSQDIATANSYIGRNVHVSDGQGNITSGDVSSVEISGGVPRLTIGDYTYPLSAVLAVSPGGSSTQTSTAQ